MTILPFLIATLAAIWWSRRRGGKGRIRLPESLGEGGGAAAATSIGRNLLEIAASVPWFLVGVAGVFVGWAKELEIPWLSQRMRRTGRGGYRYAIISSLSLFLFDMHHSGSLADFRCLLDSRRSVHLDDDAE